MVRPNPNPENPEKTGFNCAACDRPDDEESQMVFCDHCQQWFHFGCVGVTAEIKDVSWCCQECSDRKGESEESGSSSELQKELKKLEKEKKKQKRILEKERILHQKRMEVQQELFEMRQQVEQEKRNMELEFEKAQMEKKIAEEETHQKKLNEMREEMEAKLKQLKLKRKKELTGREVEQEGAVGGEDEESSKNVALKTTKPDRKKPGQKLEKKKSRNGKPGKALPMEAVVSDA
ncbi:moesin-like [Armigeres subalbatus]|uniref:moesin-like n=1 Tax=Armigeres subalbatus TaxID=124917 RepID=UPI002ED679E8